MMTAVAGGDGPQALTLRFLVGRRDGCGGMGTLLMFPSAFEGPRQALHLTLATKDLMDSTAQVGVWITKSLMDSTAKDLMDSTKHIRMHHSREL